MDYLVACLGLVLIAIALSLTARADLMQRVLHRFLEHDWLALVSFLRVLFGGIMIIFSSHMAHPSLIFWLGVIVLTAGMLIPMLGKERIDALARWWMGLPETVARIWGVVAALIGALMVWGAVVTG